MNHQSSIFAVSVYNHESQSLFSSWPFSPFFPNDLPILGPFPPVKAQKKIVLDHTLVDPLTKGSDATAGRTVHVPSAPWVKLISDGEMVR